MYFTEIREEVIESEFKLLLFEETTFVFYRKNVKAEETSPDFKCSLPLEKCAN